MMLKITEHVETTIFLLYKQKIFAYFTQKNRNLAQFSGPACIYDVITT